MPVFNDIGKKLSQTGQDAVKRTKDMFEAGKLNSQVNAEKRRIAGLYQQIGKVYFERFSENPDERAAGMCAEIKESRRKIAEWQAEINVLKGIAECPACGFENAINANFCSSCGAPMAKKDESGDTAQ
jgi:hypothetical protein